MKRSVSHRSTPAGDALTITFTGPHTFCTESSDILADCPERKAGGIFFTAVPVDDRFRITHIGQTGTSFYARLKEHVIQTLGGNFRICDPQALTRGETKVLWDGLWRTGRHAKLPEFLRAGDRLFAAAKSCFALEKVFVAPLVSEERIRKRIKAAVAKQIRQDPVAASLFPPDVRYLGKLTTETAVTIRIVTPRKILGLPEHLDI